MERKGVFKAVGIGVLVIMALVTVLIIMGVMPGAVGDWVITGTSVVVALVIYFHLRKETQSRQHGDSTAPESRRTV